MTGGKRVKQVIIGITSSIAEETLLSTTLANIWSVNDAEVLPVVLPNIADKAEHYADMVDGVLLTGGGDIDPALFGEDPHPLLGEITPERDQFEVTLTKALLARNKPLLAICRGVQILAIAGGGDMYQDLPSQFAKPLIQHRQHAPRSYKSHQITIGQGTRLETLAKGNTAYVNSYHHQAVRKVPEGFKASAWTNDGVIEAIENSASYPFQVGVQWHPETLVDDEFSTRLFHAFIASCK